MSTVLKQYVFSFTYNFIKDNFIKDFMSQLLHSMKGGARTRIRFSHFIYA